MRWMRTSVLVSLLLACTLLIGCGGTAVPDVVGVDSAAAVKTMRNAGLSPQVRRRPSSIVDKGIVISTDPAQGKVLADGARVSLSVSSGPPFKMTDVVATAEALPFAASSVSDPVSFSGASMDGGAAYPSDCWPSGFEGAVRRTGYGTYSVPSGVLSIAVYDLGSEASAADMQGQVADAENRCATGTQPTVLTAGGVGAAQWTNPVSTDGFPGSTTLSVIGDAQSTVSQGLRVVFAQGRFLCSANITNFQASPIAATDPATPDPDQQSTLSAVISTEQALIEAKGPTRAVPSEPTNSTSTSGSIPPIKSARTSSGSDVALAPLSASAFSIDLPSKWRTETLEKDEGSYVDTVVVSPSSDAYKVRIDYSMGNSITGRASALSLERNMRSVAGYQRLGITDTTLAGMPGVAWSFLSQGTSGQLLHTIDVLATDGSNGWGVMFHVPAADWAHWKPTLDRILSSFQPR